MSLLTYLRGDATAPLGEGRKLIAHVVNDCDVWGAGFVMAISKRWPEPEHCFRSHRKALGSVQFVPVEHDTHVVNMCAQQGLPSAARRVALDYRALAMCLDALADTAKANGASVHCPRMGCGIAGGDWTRVESLLLKHVCARGVAVFVYDL